MSNAQWQEYFRKTLSDADSNQLYRRRAWHVDEGEAQLQLRHGRRLINFGTNDYLGLRHDRRLAQAVAEALSTSGVGAGASPLVSGYSIATAELERKLAQWQGTEAALVFSSGMAMNIGVIAALVGPDDLVLSDRLNHASLIDGCRLSGAHKRVYPHADIAAVTKLLEQERGRYARAIVLSESIFSMDGDLAPLAELADICERFDAGLIVDEAHSTGVFGATGAGLGEELQATGKWLAKLGTLSKAIGTCGGFVAGSQSLVDFLVNRCRSYIYSTSIAPTVVAATLASVDCIPTLSERRARLREATLRVCQTLQEQGWRVPTSRAPIIPVIVGDSQAALMLSQRLTAAGCFVPAIRPPTVPDGGARLRISLSATHTDAQLSQLLQAMAELRPAH